MIDLVYKGEGSYQGLFLLFSRQKHAPLWNQETKGDYYHDGFCVVDGCDLHCSCWGKPNDVSACLQQVVCKQDQENDEGHD